MKREFQLFIVVIILFLTLSLVSSFDLSLPKTTYYPGETMQLEIPNAFIDILTTSNVLIYSKGAVHNSPASTNILKYDNKYHFYAVLPTTPGDYELRIEGVKYWDGSVQSEAPITADFSIVSTNESYLSFTPGYVYTSSGFSVNLKAYNADQTVEVDFPELGFKKSFSMGYGDMKALYFDIPATLKETVKSSIKINEYSIPAVILVSGYSSPVQNQTDEPSETDQSLRDIIAFDNDKINGSIYSGVDYYYQIVIVNRDKNVRNIKISSSSPEIKVSPTTIDTLYKEEIINITVNSNADLDEYVRFSTNESAMTVKINLIIAQQTEEPSTNIPSTTEGRKCVNLGGVICVGEEKCSGSRTSSEDSPTGNCCLGNCSMPSSSTAWLWGLLILIILIAGGWFLYQKANKGEGPEFLQNVFKKKTTDYQKRMNPVQNTSSPEVRRSLGKI